MSFDWKGLLGNVAPVLGTAIGGPFGALAGAAVKAVLGLGTDSTEEEMAKALEKATPEQLLAIQNAERQFKLDMEKLNVDVLKLDADDRNSARLRETNVKDWMPKVLGVSYTAGALGLASYVIMHGLANVDNTTAGLVGTVIGYLFNEAKQVTTYYFGSSVGSQRKDTMLFNSTPADSK